MKGGLLGELLGTQKHLALVGATGSGKTSAAMLLLHAALIEGYSDRVAVLDFDGEYYAPARFEPPFLIPKGAPLPWLVSQTERAEESGHGIAMAVASAQGGDWEVIAKLLRARTDGPSQAALYRVSVLAKYTMLSEYVKPSDLYSNRLAVYDLSPIVDPEERAIVQQFMASLLTYYADPNARTLLVIEEGGAGVNVYFLKTLLMMARRRGVKLFFISQALPPLELLNSFTLLLFDMGPQTQRVIYELKAPIPLKKLKVGEAWLIDGPSLPKKVKFPKIDGVITGEL